MTSPQPSPQTVPTTAGSPTSRRRPALLRAPVLPIVLSLLLTAALAGGVAWSVTGKTATVSLDGAARSVDVATAWGW